MVHSPFSQRRDAMDHPHNSSIGFRRKARHRVMRTITKGFGPLRGGRRAYRRSSDPRRNTATAPEEVEGDRRQGSRRKRDSKRCRPETEGTSGVIDILHACRTATATEKRTSRRSRWIVGRVRQYKRPARQVAGASRSKTQVVQTAREGKRLREKRRTRQEKE